MESKEETKTEPILATPVVCSTNVRELRTYQKYQVRVPPGLHAGDAVYIQLVPSNEMLKIMIPNVLDEHNTFHVEVLPDGHNYKYIEAPIFQHPQPVVRRMRRRIEDSLSLIWLTIGLLIISLLIASFSVASFGRQLINSDCNARNPYSGQLVTQMDYILTEGICSIGQVEDFCIDWNNENAWSRVDGAIVSSSSSQFNPNMSYSARNKWSAVVGLIISSFVFSVFGAVSIFTGLVQRVNAVGNAMNVLLVSGASLWFLIVWILILSAYNTAWLSSTMSPSAWTKFYQSSVSFAQVLNEGAQIDSSPGPTCYVTIDMGDNQGILFLLIALPTSFFLSIWMLLQRCCGQYDDYLAYPIA